MNHAKQVANRQLVDRYIAEIRRHPLLTREQEFRIASAMQASDDPRLAQELVVANLRFVVKVAHEFRGYGVALLDLIQEGNVGLMLAVKKFDPSRGYRLISYAVWWIRAYIQAFVMRTWSVVKIGTTVTQRRLFFRLRAERLAADRKCAPGEHVSPLALAMTLGVHEADINEMDLRLGARDFSLDTRVGEEGRQSFVELVLDPEPSPEELCSTARDRYRWDMRIQRAKAVLDERERFILEARLCSETPMTLREIGNRYGISRERVRQIQLSALRKLRFALKIGTARVAA